MSHYCFVIEDGYRLVDSSGSEFLSINPQSIRSGTLLF
jgi:hypothetical protein